MKMRWQPAVRSAPPYHDDPAYIDALARSIAKSLAKLDFKPEMIIATFHGMPQKYLEKGDPYHCQCQKTSRLLREKLGMHERALADDIPVALRQRSWLQPYTDKTVESLAKSGTKKIALVAPGFSADCLETLEELDVENRHIFEIEWRREIRLPAGLNDSPEGIDVIEAVVRRELMGWI